MNWSFPALGLTFLWGSWRAATYTTVRLLKFSSYKLQFRKSAYASPQMSMWLFCIYSCSAINLPLSAVLSSSLVLCVSSTASPPDAGLTSLGADVKGRN